MLGVNGITRRGTMSSYASRLNRAPTCSCTSSRRVASVRSTHALAPQRRASTLTFAPPPPPPVRAVSVRSHFQWTRGINNRYQHREHYGTHPSTTKTSSCIMLLKEILRTKLSNNTEYCLAGHNATRQSKRFFNASFSWINEVNVFLRTENLL